MIKRIFILVSIFISFEVSAQNYFNKRFEYNQPGWWDGANSVCKLSNGYVLTGLYQYYCPHCIGFYKMDFQGNKIISKTYCDDTTEYYNGIGSIVALNADTILAVGQMSTPTADWWHDLGILLFLDSNLDTLSTRRFGEQTTPYDTGYLFSQLKVDPQRNIILTGSHYVNNGNSRAKMLLVKADINGNLKWKRLYGSGLNYDGLSVICTSDGGYAIGGYGYGLPIPPDYSGDPVVLKTDSAGNQQWMLNLGGPWQDRRAMICNTVDGKIIVGTSYCDSMQGGGPSTEGNAYRRINIIKLDNSGNVLWNKKYGSSEMFNELSNIRENSDGSLIACGFTTRRFSTSYDYAGWMLKTDINGDSLWYRQYVICNGQTSWNWLGDVIQTDDNGYLSGGVVYVSQPDTGSHDGWALKVDSLGCENPANCWVGIGEKPEIIDNNGVRIFPNPADNFTTISLFKDLGELPVTIRLYDIFGREVKTFIVKSSLNDYQIDLTMVPDGLYLVLVESQNQIIGREKFFIRKI